MTIDEQKNLIEILKIVIWPAALVWLVWYLRDEVKRASTRITEIGLTGAKFAPPEQTPSSPTGITASTGIAAGTGAATATGTGVTTQTGTPITTPGLQHFISTMIEQVSRDQLEPSVQAIRTDLSKRVGNDQKDQIEALLYFSAATSIQLTHERNYNMIFGSQLQLLAQMNVDAGVLPKVAKEIYESAKSANPAVYQDFAFDQWIAFLQASSLIVKAPNGNYVLTTYGRGFLKYILDRHLSVNKPF